MPKSAKNKGVANNTNVVSHTLDEPSKVPSDVNTDTANVTSSDKLDNKLSNKPKASDSGLTEIIESWPRLPNDIQSAIPFVRGLD